MRWHVGDYARQSFTLTWNDGTSALIGAESVKIVCKLDSSTPDPLPDFEGDCDITDETKGTVSYLFASPQTDVAGMYKYWFVITYTDGTTKSVPSGDVQWLFMYA